MNTQSNTHPESSSDPRPYERDATINDSNSAAERSPNDHAPDQDRVKNREHFIPISRRDLFDSLPDIQTVSEPDQTRLRELFHILESLLHHQYHMQFAGIERNYQPLDPDCVMVASSPKNKPADEDADRVFSELKSLLKRANYRRLSNQDLEDAIDNASVLGIKLQVDFSLFEELHVYARGDRVEQWTKRTWWKFFRKEEFDVDVYQRLIIAFRLRDEVLEDKDHSADVIYIKSFKNIPHSDMHALLPGTKVKMSLVDQGKIILPALSGLAISLFKVVRLLMVFSIFATIFSFFQVTGLVIGIGLYVAKVFIGYIQTKDKYLLNLTRHLYFQNLDNNSGVLLRVLSEAEEQDYREIIISYYVLWKFGADGLTSKEVDEIAEINLHQKTELAIDFEVDDALKKLHALQLADAIDGKWKCRDIDESLRNLDFRWDSFYPYNWPANGSTNQPS